VEVAPLTSPGVAFLSLRQRLLRTPHRLALPRGDALAADNTTKERYWMARTTVGCGRDRARGGSYGVSFALTVTVVPGVRVLARTKYVLPSGVRSTVQVSADVPAVTDLHV